MVPWQQIYRYPVRQAIVYIDTVVLVRFITVGDKGISSMEVSNLRESRRAHRAHLTRVFGKIAPILESDEAPNERNTATLQTELEQIEAKRTTISELDTEIRATIEDATALETEILDAEEITFTIAEKITLIKAVLTRSKPPNAQAPPLQPLSVQTSDTSTPIN